MHLQGKDLVSLATQRSARALVVTALVIVLAKHYAVLPADLTLVGVTIDQSAVSGAIFWVVGFQAINHLIHWWGDYKSMWAWNSKEKVNGFALHGAGAEILSKLDYTIKEIATLLEQKKTQSDPEYNFSDELASIQKNLSDLKPTIESYRSFGAFYFFGWFLALPLAIALAAICWPELPQSAASAS